MKKNIMIYLILITAFFVFTIGNSLVYAESNYELENVLIKLNDGSIVKLKLSDYGIAYLSKTKSDIYNFLIKDYYNIKLLGITSQDKTVLIEEYGLKYLRFKRLGNLSTAQIISKAIEDSSHNQELHLNNNDISEYKVDVQSISFGNMKFQVNSNVAQVFIPSDKLSESIKNVIITFDKPVKITKINGTDLPQIIIDKMKSSNYSLDNYYDEFSFNIGDQYKYSMIFDFGTDSKKSVTNLTVINELGFERNIKVILNR